VSGWYGYNQSSMWKKIRLLLSFCLLAISIGLILWSVLPAQHLVEVQSIQANLEGLYESGEKQPRLAENRQVRMEWPASVRIADKAGIRLVFENIKETSSSIELNSGFYNIYERYNIMAEAKVEAAGLTIEPANPTRVSMPPGQPVHFKWVISTQKSGIYYGKVWLSLRFLPLDGSTPIQEPVYVNDLELIVNSMMGLSGSMARLVGGLCGVISILLVSSDLINLATRRKKENAAPLASYAEKGTKIMDAKEL
jgi:hypothetical protein